MTSDHREELVRQYQRNLEILQRQQAMFGFAYTPIHIINQIDETKQKLDELGGLPANTSRDILYAAIQPTHHAPRLQVIADLDEQLEPLIQHLRLRGIRVIQPQRDVHGSLRQAVGALLVVRGQAVKKVGFSQTIEPYLHYLRSQPTGKLFILAEQLSRKQSDQLFPAEYREQIIWFTPTDAPAMIAKLMLTEILTPVLDQIPDQQSIDIDLFSYGQAEYRYPGLLAIDTRTLGTEPPDWEALWRALLDVREILNTNRQRNIAVRPMNSRLSVAMAFGAVFATTARFNLHVAYEPRAKLATDLETAEWWRQHPHQPHEPLLRQSYLSDTIAYDQDWAIWLNVTRRINVSAERAITVRQLNLSPIVQYETQAVGMNAITTGDEGRFASAVANEFGEQLRRERDLRPDTIVHFFYALPVALAVMIGQQLNACGTIQCYEFLNEESRYVPSCVIRSTQR